MNQTHKCKDNCNLLIQSGRFGEVVQNNLLSELRKNGIYISPTY